MASASPSWRLATPFLRNHASPSRHSNLAPSYFALFSTTTMYRNPLPMQTKKAVMTRRGERNSFRMKRKRGQLPTASYRPAPGDRRAIRKRVVLSNVNALDVELQDLSANMQLEASQQGQILGLPGPIVDRLRATQAFKPTQSWGWFKRPAFLIRPETIEMSRILQEAPGAETTPRYILTGEMGSGKSVLLLQTQAMALLKDWVVISIPEGNDLNIAHTSYAPIPNTNPPLYTQNTYTIELLTSIANANPILQTLKIEDPKTKALPYAKSITNLADLCLSAKPGAHPDADVEPWTIFEALWAELTHPGRPPVLLAVDGLTQIMRETEYRNPEFEPIHAHDLVLVRWFVEHLSGARQLPNGGAVVAAMCGSCGGENITLDARLQQLRAEQMFAAGTLKHDPAADPIAAFLEATEQKSDPVTPLDPHVRWDQRVLDTLAGGVSAHATKKAAPPAQTSAESGSNPSNAQEEASSTMKKEQAQTSKALTSIVPPPRVLQCTGLDRDEARKLMEYWARSGMLRAPVTGTLVAQQWTLSGGGVIGELERGCFRMRV